MPPVPGAEVTIPGPTGDPSPPPGLAPAVSRSGPRGTATGSDGPRSPNGQTIPGEPGRIGVPDPPPAELPPLLIATRSLPPISVGTAWAADFEATGGGASYRWSITEGAVPRGFVLQPSGRLGGTAQTPDPAAFTIGVTASRGEVATRQFTLDPTPRTGDINTDGPVDCLDKAILDAQWGRTAAGLTADLDSDETVDITDMSILLSNWTGDSREC